MATTDRHNETTPMGKKILCSGLVTVLLALVIGGVLYCLLTQPHFISRLTPQGPIGFH